MLDRKLDMADVESSVAEMEFCSNIAFPEEESRVLGR